MSMILEVDPDSAVPPYEQIRSQIETMIAHDVLTTGTRLPAIRQLAKDLRLAEGTVGRAYRELEHAGLIGGRGRNGMSVVDGDGVEHPDGARALDEAARVFALRARQLGVAPGEALRSAERALGSR